jgi:predicted Na+-dependent transporter
MSKFKFIVITFIILLIVFALPRLLISNLGSENPWTSFLYIYTLGAIFFTIGLTLSIQTKAIRLDLKADRQWFRGVIFGFFFFLSLHGAWIYFALNGPQFLN